MPQTTVLRAGSGWQAINFRDIWEYRELLVSLSFRDIRLRYKQTALGVVWVILQPLLGAGIFSFVFGKIAKLPSDGIPYFAFAYSGLMCWTLFTNTWNKASLSLVNNSHLISKIYFPRMIMPLSGIPSSLLDFSIAAFLMSILMVLYRIVPHVGILLLPVWLIILMMLALGFGLWSGALAVKYRDINFIVPVAIQMLLYASPIAYAASSVPVDVQKYYYLNPVAGLMDAIRWSILGTGEMKWWTVIYSASFALVFFVVGALIFRKMEREFADVI